MNGGLFSGIFGGSQIHNMNVNFNINGNDRTLNNMKSAFLPGKIPNQHVMVGYQKPSILYSFKNTFIDSNYTLILSDEYDKSIRPKEEFDTLNNYYFVSEYSGQNSYKCGDKEETPTIGEIINRKDKFPSIVTLLDHESIENKEIIDQILFNTLLITRVYKHKNFFLIFETSGSKEIGEPCVVTFDKNKGLFQKEIYSINISE